uniref:Uncharacterized protein n=1 Tax=Arundo donax TaxID=35708 RepID=A0A0A9B6W4_ARUDO
MTAILPKNKTSDAIFFNKTCFSNNCYQTNMHVGLKLGAPLYIMQSLDF